MCRTGNASEEDQRTQPKREKPEGKNKSAHKSNDITMTPARTQSIITSTPNTGEQEKSAPKKTRSARKKDLLAFFGEGACVQPPSMDGTPIEAAKTRRSPGSGISGATKKRDKHDCSDAIGQKKSKSDDEESLGGVANLESMDETPLKPKGLKSTSRKGLAKKDKAAKNPRLREEKGNVCRDSGKRGGERKRNRV